MPAHRSIARTLLLGGLGIALMVLLSMPEGKANGISPSAEHLPGELAESVWKRFRESDSLGALAMLHFSSYVEQPVLKDRSERARSEFAGDANLILDVQRIRGNERERLEPYLPGKLDLAQKYLTSFAPAQKETDDDWGNAWNVHCDCGGLDFNVDL